MDSEKTKKEYDEVRRYGHQALILCYRHAELPCDCHLPQLIHSSAVNDKDGMDASSLRGAGVRGKGAAPRRLDGIYVPRWR